ncbi:PilZ domain-containing protein [Vibrio clamense]|uniref:PilZ domain-containing protein n=1 Tax=Vibrio TaxID=662 RepID=UPI000DE83404|nr:PilZ domain-containing protein [Vibrionales bacterium C3R12]
MEKEVAEQKRQYYRLKYPKKARPLIRIGDQLIPVSEVSEKGLRIVRHDFSALYKGLIMAGILRLHGDRQIPVQGPILRFDGNEVIIKLDEGITFKDMFEEQRYIRQKYPVHFTNQNRQTD